jgi:hypothetical protein
VYLSNEFNETLKQNVDELQVNDIVKVVKSRRLVRMKELRREDTILERKSIGKRQLLRPKWGPVDNITIGAREICCEDGRWMELAQDRVQWQALILAVLNLRVLLPELVT